MSAAQICVWHFLLSQYYVREIPMPIPSVSLPLAQNALDRKKGEAGAARNEFGRIIEKGGKKSRSFRERAEFNILRYHRLIASRCLRCLSHPRRTFQSFVQTVIIIENYKTKHFRSMKNGIFISMT